MTKFEVGQIVHLKSGGPNMTVTEIVVTGTIRCHWFAGQKCEHGVFPPEALDLVPDEEKVEYS